METTETLFRKRRKHREVYFVRAKTLGLIKIGVANTARERFVSLQTDSPDLKSPTCGDCAMATGRHVPGDVHTIYEGVCANCGQTRPVSSASDWRLPGERVHPEAWD